MRILSPTAGQLLRMLGPLIQVACLIVLFRDPAGRWMVAGVAARTLAYWGLLLGFALVASGLILSPGASRRDRTWRL